MEGRFSYLWYEKLGVDFSITLHLLKRVSTPKNNFYGPHGTYITYILYSIQLYQFFGSQKLICIKENLRITSTVSQDLCGCRFYLFLSCKKAVRQPKTRHCMRKVIYPKYSKHWPYTLAHTIDCVCSKMLNHGLFQSLFKLISCLKHWIVRHVLAYSNFIFEF